MVKIGTVAFDLVAFTGNFTKPIKQAEASINTLAGKLNTAGRAAVSFGNKIRSGVGSALRDIQGMITGTAGKLTMLTGGLGATGLVGYAVKQAIAFEDAQMAFATFLKSGDKAKALLKELTKFSDVTPFTDTDVQQAGRALLAFGFSAEEIIPTLQYLGDAAAGTQSDINDLVNIIGKVRTKGRAQMEELNRFIERGVNIMPELAKEFTRLNGGIEVTTADVAKFVTAGKVGFTDVVKAMKALNTEGGLFQNAMQNLSTTTSGKLSTLKSAFDSMMRDVGKALLEGLNIKQLTDQLITLAATYKQDVVDATLAGVEVLLEGLRMAKELFGPLVDLAIATERYKNVWAGRMEYMKSAGVRGSVMVQKALGAAGPQHYQGDIEAVRQSDERLRKIIGRIDRLDAYSTTPDPDAAAANNEKVRQKQERVQQQQLEMQKKMWYQLMELNKRGVMLAPADL